MSAALQTAACEFVVNPEVGRTEEKSGAQIIFLGRSSDVVTQVTLQFRISRLCCARYSLPLSVSRLKIMDVTSEDSIHY